MNAEESDLSLVRRVQRGDKRAFDVLVLKYQHKVVKLVMRYVRGQAEAEDVAQEAFIKAYRALPQFRGDSAFYTWLYRIAINTAKNALASRERSPISYELDNGDRAEIYESQGRMKDTATPEALAMTDEIRATVNAGDRGAAGRRSCCANWKACPTRKSRPRWMPGKVPSMVTDIPRTRRPSMRD
ncbi:MAG: sigma-70 family RNA polymerase sigma factor [Steroidobacteraceae bacterium]